jgi:hypothetical protein
MFFGAEQVKLPQGLAWFISQVIRSTYYRMLWLHVFSKMINYADVQACRDHALTMQAALKDSTGISQCAVTSFEATTQQRFLLW